MNTYKITTVSQVLTVGNCINAAEAKSKTGLTDQEIVSIKFETGLLSHLYEIAYRAHTGTSFSPEQRGRSIVQEYSEQLAEDLTTIPEAERAQYQAGYEKHLTAWLRAKGNCISTMITGPSNFPVRRAEKANAAESARYNEFYQWGIRAMKAIKNKAEAAKPIEQKRSEQQTAFFKEIKAVITDKAATIIGIDNGTIRGTVRQLIVSNLTGFITRIANKGNKEATNFALDCVRELNKYAEDKGGKAVIGPTNGIWKLAQVVEVVQEQQFDRAQKPNREYPFEKGKVVFNYELDRLQLVYDAKPDYSTINTLKRNGFKWSPTNTAWQRQLTNNAIYATVNIIGEFRQPATVAAV